MHMLCSSWHKLSCLSRLLASNIWSRHLKKKKKISRSILRVPSSSAKIMSSSNSTRRSPRVYRSRRLYIIWAWLRSLSYCGFASLRSLPYVNSTIQPEEDIAKSKHCLHRVNSLIQQLMDQYIYLSTVSTAWVKLKPGGWRIWRRLVFHSQYFAVDLFRISNIHPTSTQCAIHYFRLRNLIINGMSIKWECWKLPVWCSIKFISYSLYL